eukprot:982976-Prorocentrum_minimum.AAC.1
MCTRGAAGVHKWGSHRCAHVGQPVCTRGTAGVHKWSSRCAHSYDMHTRDSPCAHAALSQPGPPAQPP